MTSSLNETHINHLLDFLNDTTAFDPTEVDRALARKVADNNIPAAPNARGEWLKAIKEAYDALTTLYREVNDLYEQYARLIQTFTLAPRSFEIHPRHRRTGSIILPPNVEMYDAVLLSRESADLRKRLLLLVRAKALKESMRERLEEAIDEMVNDVPSSADRLLNAFEDAMEDE